MQVTTPAQNKILELALESWIFKMEQGFLVSSSTDRVHPSERELVKQQIAEAKQMLAALRATA